MAVDSKDELEEPFRSMIETFGSPEIQAMLREIYKTVGYTAPFHLRRVVQRYFEAFNSPATSLRFDWDNSSNFSWKKEALEGQYHMRMALMATSYHAENLSRMETDLRAIGKRFDLQRLGDSMVAGGENHLRIDFEFHSFIIAFRRTIDQFSRMLFACIKDRVHSFNDVERLFAHRFFERFSYPEQLRAALVYARSEFVFCLSEGSNKTMRDRIVHWDYVPSGTVNVSVNGIILFNPEIGAPHPIAVSKFCDDKLNSLLEVLNRAFESIAAP